MKRTLPDSGRYDLECHLPVYLWRQYCDRCDIDPFWELLELLRKHQSVFCNEEELVDESDTEPIGKVSCYYCGNEYKNNRGLNIHLRTCDEK